WQEERQQAQPESVSELIASEVLELAIQELERSLPSAVADQADEPLSLDAAMTFLTRHSPTE
ncbi:MAG: hypothetical protein JSS02_27290, partial [Planctomycetes bacterium]|nr:hypothetical protein [Planctomycetota bacterium]